MNMHALHGFSGSQLSTPSRVKLIHFDKTHSAVVAQLPKTVSSTAVNAAPTQTFGQPLHQRSLSEQLFVALADAKIWTSKLAMHLDRSARDRLFRQLDLLHDEEEWAPEDKPVNLASYKTLVRAILYHQVDSRPALSLMPNGNLLALWRDGDDKLTVEFLPDNRTRWFVQCNSDSGPERVTGTTPLERLRTVLQPYGAERWFDGG
jgi:hypothetical protein